MTPVSIFNIDLPWVLLGALAAISLFWLWERSRIPSLNKIPPCPVQPWPVVGHFFMLRGNLRDKMKDWRKRTGGIYSLYFGRQLYIVVNDFDVIKEIMNKHSDVIVNTPPSFTSALLGERNKGIIFARDDNWREQRAISLSILRSFGMGKDLMANKIQTEVTVLCEKLSSFNGQPINPKLFIHTAVSNVICSVAFGERFQHEDPVFAQMVEAITFIQKHAMLIVMLSPLKALYHLPWDMFNVKKWEKAAFLVLEFINSYIRKFKMISNEPGEEDNFITVYLREMKRNTENGVDTHLSEENLTTIVRTLFIAGTESTVATIMWCLIFMIHNPEIQEKIYQEIEENVGSGRFPCVGDKQKLPYLNAVVMETQRLASVVPTCLTREVKSSFEIRGFIVPKGSVLWPILDSVHHDKDIWGDPEKFRPERFIDNNGAIINREELIPFGIGKRVCIGESIVRMELFLVLSSLLQRFKFEPADGEALPSLKGSFAAVCEPKTFQAKVVLRRE